MTPTPPSTNSSSAGQSPDNQYRVVRKRNRIPLSCAPCRHRKLKCNRGHPCDNCTKRGDTVSCTYATSANRKKSGSGSAASASPDDMQNRIDRLEGLVLSLMTNGSQSAGPQAAQAALASSISGSSQDNPVDLNAPDSIKEEEENAEESEVEQVAKSIGVMKMDNNKSMFISEAHWYAILGEISEVKNYFNEHKKQYDDQLLRLQAQKGDESKPGMAYLLGGTKPASHQEILASFPPRSVADLLITRFFNTHDPALHIIHGPTFQKQYERHYMNPQESPVIWLGLCFSMMCIALQSYHRAGDEPPEYRGKSWQVSTEYRQLTAQCLLLSDITQPLMYTIETLLLHVYADYARSKDAEFGILLSVSIIVRLAMRMGYHRDPGSYSNIPPFQAEMRRRVWTAVRQSDLLFSAQAGMPPMIRSRDTNTEFPRNVYDDELYEDIKSLPPSRPDSEVTPVSYMIAKARYIYLFGMVVEEAQSLNCSNYEDIMKLDQRLKELRASLTPQLQMRSMEDSVRDIPSLIMQRFSLELIYLKSICVLHRKFLGLSRENSRFAYSRRTCIDASMMMLQHQATLHDECQSGGRLRTVKWFISSLTNHDFLLAAMVVTLDLYHTAETERSGKTSPTDVWLWSQDRQEEMLAAVERALMIWDELKEHSMEAFKAHTTLSVMVKTLKSHRAMRQVHSSFAAAAGSFPPNGTIEDPNVSSEHSAAMTLGMLSTGALTPNTASIYDTRQPYPAAMGNILNDNPQAQPQQPGSGLTPNFGATTTMGEASGPANAPSPFSNLFGPSLGFQGMEMPSADINWDAWDNYIQGTTLDPNNGMWPMDIPNLSTPIPDVGMNGLNPAQAQANGQPNGANGAQAGMSNNAFASGGSVFMGSM